MKADHLVAVSDFTAIETKTVFALNQPIKVIHNGVDVINSWLPNKLNTGIKRYAFFGSLIKKKGVIELIVAWIKFTHSHSDTQLEIFGKDIEGLETLLKARVATHDVSNVVFHGVLPKEDLIKQLQDVDFCVFPSKAEAFALAPMEAMSLGKVVLYSNQTSATELIQDGSNGLLIEATDEESILRSLERAYVMSAEEYKQVSENAIACIQQKFSLEKQYQKNIELYNSICL